MVKQKDGPVHDGLPEVLGIDNMANGAVYEMLGDALKKLAGNVADPNTKPEQKRTITLKIEAKPYKDRSGAEYSIHVDTKLAGIRPAESTMYFAKKDGEHLAFGRNTQQEEIQFDMKTPEPAPKPKLQ